MRALASQLFHYRVAHPHQKDPRGAAPPQAPLMAYTSQRSCASSQSLESSLMASWTGKCSSSEPTFVGDLSVINHSLGTYAPLSPPGPSTIARSFRTLRRIRWSFAGFVECLYCRCEDGGASLRCPPPQVQVDLGRLDPGMRLFC